MKAKIKRTGEIVEVTKWINGADKGTDDFVYYNDRYNNKIISRGMNFYRDLEPIKEESKSMQEQSDINWEQRRYELAKVVLQCYLASDNTICNDTVKIAKGCVLYADALIKELKKEKK